MGEQKEPEKAPSKKSYGTLDNESQKEEKIPYPKSVLLIIATEFCERFSYFGMRTVLSLYFKFLKFFKYIPTPARKGRRYNRNHSRRTKADQRLSETLCGTS